MIPNAGSGDVTILTPESIPTRTYHLDFERKTINGKVDGAEAMKQAIYLILNTERFYWPVYSWNYGTELIDLAGQSPYYVEAELERRIVDALMQDDRVVSVSGFTFRADGATMTATFTVKTTVGDVTVTKEMYAGV